MNLVGKIFTVLIFVMCLVFATFALMVHAAHQNWYAVVKTQNQQLLELNKQHNEALEEQKRLQKNLDDEKAQIRSRIIALENEAKIAIADRDARRAELQSKENEAVKLSLAIQGAEEHLKVLQASVESMRKEINLTVDQRDLAQKQLVATTDDLNNAVAEKGRLDKLQRQLAEQIIKLKESLAYWKVTLNHTKTPPVGAQGEVTAVPRPDVVEISLGADEGVLKGHRFVVTRPSTGKYIGVIQVIQVDYGNRAVCRPDKALLNDQIQKGDHVEADTKAH